MEVREMNPQKYRQPSEEAKALALEKMKKLRKESEKLVKGMFEFLDAKDGGGWLDFSYRLFPGEPIRCVRIVHGEIVDVPMGLVRHLNNVHKKIRVLPKEMDEQGNYKGKGTLTRISRCRFTPMDVM